MSVAKFCNETCSMNPSYSCPQAKASCVRDCGFYVADKVRDVFKDAMGSSDKMQCENKCEWIPCPMMQAKCKQSCDTVQNISTN